MIDPTPVPRRGLRDLVMRAYRSSGRWDWARRSLAALTRRYRTTPHVIRHGVGAGLTFNSHGGALGFALGTTEQEEQRTLARVLKRGDVFYDVGANKGFYAVIAARLVGPQGSVHAFEPFADSVGAIEDNVRLNSFRNVTVWPAAVSDAPGMGSLLTDGGDFEFRLSTSLNAPLESDPTAVQVEVVQLDQLVSDGRLPPPNVVMIDVEGAEVAVLRGMAGILENHRPVVMCEVHWLKDEIDEILADLLEPLGYVATQLDGSPLPAEITRYHMLLRPA